MIACLTVCQRIILRSKEIRKSFATQRTSLNQIPSIITLFQLITVWSKNAPLKSSCGWFNLIFCTSVCLSHPRSKLKSSSMALKWDQSERSQNFRYKVTAVFVGGLFSEGVAKGSRRQQMRCRLILLISEHPIQQGIRKGGVRHFGHEDEDEDGRTDGQNGVF